MLVFRSFWQNFGIRKNFEKIFRKLGRNFAEICKLENMGNAWKKKKLNIFKKIRKEFRRNKNQLFEFIFYAFGKNFL